MVLLKLKKTDLTADEIQTIVNEIFREQTKTLTIGIKIFLELESITEEQINLLMEQGLL